MAVTRFFYESSMPASALDKEVTFAGAVLFERKRLDFEKPEATPGDRIGLRRSGRHEEPYLLNERQAEVVLISSLMKQVYKQIDRIIHSRMQNKSITTLNHIEIQILMLYKTVTWNVVNENRRLCSMPNLHQTSKTRRDILYLCILHTKHFRGGQEASRTTDQQSIHHVRLWNSQFRVLRILKCRITKTEESKRFLGFRRDKITERSWNATSKTSNTKCAWTKIHAIRHGRIWQNSKWKNGFTSLLLANGLTTETNTKVVQTYQGADRSTPWIQTHCTVEKRTTTRQSSVPDAEQWSSWSSWTWSLSSRSSWWGSSSSQTWRQSQGPTTSDVPTLVFNTRMNISSGQLVAATNQTERTIRTGGCTQKHTLTRTFSAPQS